MILSHSIMFLEITLICGMMGVVEVVAPVVTMLITAAPVASSHFKLEEQSAFLT